MSKSSLSRSLVARRSGAAAGVAVVVLGALIGGGALRAGASEPSTTLSAATSASASGAGTAASAHEVYARAAQFVGPVTVGHAVEPLSANPPGLAAHGYTEQEFFASGTASAFRATASPTNGRWSIAPTTSAFYRTRVLVRRPTDPANFNGTVVVEWMNVSAGESAPDWDYLNPGLMQSGDAYVGVSAQALGVSGGKAILSAGATGGLIGQEPDRYGTLVHPGDQYALDIFAQIGKALRSPDPILAGLHPRHVVGIGESQSAFYLTTFADAVQPRTHTFDGLFIHSRGGGGAPLVGGSIASSVGSTGLPIRTDLPVPVFMFETQTDLIALGFASAQQPNTRLIRTWEVAGTSHADAYEVGAAQSLLGCTSTINDGPQHEVAQAAFRAFITWVNRGVAPPSPPPFRLSSTRPAVLALDAHGNVVGGVRTPAVDVPVSTLSGAAPAGTSELCSLFGSSTPFTPATLADLYQTKGHYLSAYRASLSQAIGKGYILPADRAELVARAGQVALPS